MTNSSSIQNIQMLRAIAAILVVMHHILPHYEAMGGDIAIIHLFSHWGFVGVDIFFVISGFIMAYTTLSKERTFENAKTFIKHRLFRIYLGYWPFLLFMFIILYITNPLKIETLDIVGSIFLTNADMFQLVLPISWSLSYELYFYLIFVFTFFFTVRTLKIILPSFTLIVLFIVLIVFFDPDLESHFFYSPFLLEFFAGVLLYLYKEYLMSYWILAFSLLMVFGAYTYGISHETKNGLYRVATFGSASFFVVLVALILEYKKIFQARGLIVEIGNASYTLYLSHLVLIQMFYTLGLRRLFTSTTLLLPLIGWILLLAIAILFTLLYYKKIEKPLYKKAIQL